MARTSAGSARRLSRRNGWWYQCRHYNAAQPAATSIPPRHNARMAENEKQSAADFRWWDWLRVRLAFLIVVAYLLIDFPKEPAPMLVVGLIGFGFAFAKLFRDTDIRR